jgi:hypothetical protein
MKEREEETIHNIKISEQITAGIKGGNPVKIVPAPAELRTKHLLNTYLEHCSYANLLDYYYYYYYYYNCHFVFTRWQ